MTEVVETRRERPTSVRMEPPRSGRAIALETLSSNVGERFQRKGFRLENSPAPPRFPGPYSGEVRLGRFEHRARREDALILTVVDDDPLRFEVLFSVIVWFRGDRAHVRAVGQVRRSRLPSDGVPWVLHTESEAPRGAFGVGSGRCRRCWWKSLEVKPTTSLFRESEGLDVVVDGVALVARDVAVKILSPIGNPRVLCLVCLELDGRAFVIENGDERNLAALAAVFGELFGVTVKDERSTVPARLPLPFAVLITLVQIVSLIALAGAAFVFQLERATGASHNAGADDRRAGDHRRERDCLCIRDASPTPLAHSATRHARVCSWSDARATSETRQVSGS